MRKVFFLAGLLAAVSISLVVAAELEAGHTAYVIHDGQPLLNDKDPDAATVAKLKSHHAYTVVQISGKWVQLKSGSATGWVYEGNLSRDEPPEVNDSGFSNEASATTLNAAARGIDNDARDYANRKGEAESADDVVWMEHENDAISKDDVRTYLKDHQLGEYSGGK
jgi:hypothetical protein